MHGPMGTCFSCFSPSIEEKKDTATVVSALTIDVNIAETREDAPTPTAADDDGREGLESPQRRKQGRFKKIRSMSYSVKKGALAITPKKEALIDTMQWDEKSVVSAIPALVGALHARVKKNGRLRSMSASVNKAARAATQKKGAPIDVVQLRMTRTTQAETKSLLPYDCFLIILSGHKKCASYMVRLPYDRNTTFQDLRREIEEDYGDDFPFADFKFTVTAEGTAVSRAQERKWRVCDYDLSKGNDGTNINPHRVYVKSANKENTKKEDKEYKEDKEDKDKAKDRVMWVEGEKEAEAEAKLIAING